MKITSKLESKKGENYITLRTNNNIHSINIPTKTDGFGSSANGGELFFLALAAFYCNDIYREAEKKAIKVVNVEVEVTGDFGGEGEPARKISYTTKVSANA
jgi:organic hydroperoxide reductase OsmC/OhrA